MVKINDVIQLDPAESPWGPLLCIVSEVKDWGVQCYAFVPTERNKAPGLMYLRVNRDRYTVIGPAEFAAASSTEAPESS